jgi:hypothetical protein
VRRNGQLFNPISIRRDAGLWTLGTIVGKIERSSFPEYSEAFIFETGLKNVSRKKPMHQWIRMENVVGVRLLCRNGMEKSSEKETGESDILERNLIPRESEILISFIAPHPNLPKAPIAVFANNKGGQAIVIRSQSNPELQFSQIPPR